MKVLVTGGAGFIGSHTCLALAERGHMPVIFDNFSNAAEDVPARLRQASGIDIPVVRGDVRDAGAVAAAVRTHQPDAAIHFAALKSVEQSWEQVTEYVEVNVSGTLNVLLALTRAGVRRFVFSSSATVYSPQSPMPVTEESQLGPINPYGRTKLVGEELCAQVAQQKGGMDMVLLRYFNPVGAHPSGLIGEDPRNPPSNLMPIVAEVALGRRDAVGIFGIDYETADGTGVRDYIHVCDLADAHVAALTARTGASCLALNVGTGRGHSVLELIAAYQEASGRHIPVCTRPRRNGDAPAVWADTGRCTELLRWSASRSLAQMCEDSWRWVKRRHPA